MREGGKLEKVQTAMSSRNAHWNNLFIIVVTCLGFVLDIDWML